MLNGSIVIDSVVHSMNLDSSNNATKDAAIINDLIYEVNRHVPKGYELAKETLLRDWPNDDTVAMLFNESVTDLAVIHPTPIMAYKDGQTSVAKAIDATTRWPQRVIASYACVDPLTGSKAIDDLERQVEEMPNAIGLKLYPTSWRGEVIDNWRMDDPDIIYPVYEAAARLGIKTVAVHKAVPLGPVPTGGAFNPSDVEGAAVSFPELNFEIVHGGVAFCEETAWLLARFDNVYVNLETLTIILVSRPRVFARLLLGLLDVGGEAMLDKMFWSSGAMQIHPRLCLEAFAGFQFPDEMLESRGLFAELPQISDEHKRKILGENYARVHGLDLSGLYQATLGDEFHRREGAPLPAPYSTTSVADLVLS